MRRLPPVLLLAACTADLSDSAVETGEPGESYLVPTALLVTGAFGYDPEADQTRHFFADAHDERPLPPWMELAVAQVDPADGTTSSCTIHLQATSSELPRAAWVEEADGAEGIGLRFGFTLEAEGSDTCHRWDPDAWGDPTELALRWEWGLTVNDLRPELVAEGGEHSVRDAVVATEGLESWEHQWEPYLVGGGVRWSGLEEPGGVSTWGWAVGYEVDEDWVLVEETSERGGGHEGVHIPREAILEGEALPRGVYAVALVVPIDAEGLRAR